MNYYPKDKCIVCHKDLIKNSKITTRFSCKNKDCNSKYTVTNRSVMFYVIESENFAHLISVYYHSNSGSLSTIEEESFVDDQYYYKSFFEQDCALELSLQEWKDLINRVRKLQAFT